MKRIAVIGCGAIAGTVVEAISAGKIPVKLAAVVGREPIHPSIEPLLQPQGSVKLFDDPSGLLDMDLDIDLVFEAAHPDVVKQWAVPLLQAGNDLLPMSVGGLLEPQFRQELAEAAAASGCRIYMPAGAISGINVIEAAAASGVLDEVTIETTKAPEGLKAAPYVKADPGILENLQSRTLVFSGTVSQGMTGFPQNVNVAAAVAAAGIGPEKTLLRIFADPAAARTEHRLTAVGHFGRLELVLNIQQHPQNPRTSYLAALAAISALKKYTSSVVMGF